MMKNLIINMDEGTSLFYKSIMNDYNEYYKKIFSIEVKEDTIYIKNLIEDDASCFDLIANKIASFIIEHIEPQIIREETYLTCFDLFEEEVEDIYQRANWEIYHKNKEDAENYFLELKNDIIEILKEHNKFDLIGFLSFRLKDRRYKIIEYIEYVTDQFYEEQDNREIVDFARNIISIKDPQSEEMHLIIYDRNQFELIDENFMKLDLKELRDNMEECDDTKFILSVLMAYAPEKLIIHTNDEQSPYLTKTLLDVFDERVKICFECEFCENVRNIKNKNQE